MRALVVGAGAVGQAYGRHLVRGGAQVSFLVKPKHAAECRAGFILYALNRPRRKRAEPERFDTFGVLTSEEQVAQASWDAVFLAVSSTALREGTWFARLAAVIGDATVVLLQSGPLDRAFVLERVPAERLVQGIITLLSYRAPLPGETRFPASGVAYWFPPFTPSLMSGSDARLLPVLRTLQAGGLPVRRHADIASTADFPTAILMPLLAVLEAAHWSFRELRQGERLRQAARAGREALAVLARRLGRRPPAPLRLLEHPLVVRAVLRLAPLVMPLDVQTYLRVHFTKVGDQTRDFLRTYVSLGRSQGQPIGELSQLVD